MRPASMTRWRNCAGALLAWVRRGTARRADLDSRTRPGRRKHTRSAISRAKPISWVASSIVMPSRSQVAHDVEHLADEFGVERRGDLVEQHDLGLHRQRAGDRHALLLAAATAGRGRRRPCRRGRAGRAASTPRRVRPPRRAPSTLRGAERDVVDDSHVREQVEALEHHADPAPDRVGVEPGLADVDAVEQDRAVVDRFEQVDAAQQRALARAGRADQADDLARRRRRGRCRRARVSAPNALTTRSSCELHRDVAVPAVVAVGARGASRWSVERGSAGSYTHRKITAATTYGVKLAVQRLRRCSAWRSDLDRAEQADERDVLLQADEVVHQRRHDAPDRLRQHDVSASSGRCDSPSERAAGALALVDALDPGAEHLGHVRRVGERPARPSPR